MSAYDRRHIIVKIKGQCQKTPNDAMMTKIASFHRMCAILDPDWPYVVPVRASGVEVAPGDSRTYRYVCGQCKGVEYVSPFLSAAQIKALGKRAGLKIKVVRWEDAAKCTGSKMTEVGDGAEGWKVVGSGASLVDKIVSEVERSREAAEGERSTEGGWSSTGAIVRPAEAEDPTRSIVRCKNCHHELVEHASKTFWVHAAPAVAGFGRYYCGSEYGVSKYAVPDVTPETTMCKNCGKRLVRSSMGRYWVHEACQGRSVYYCSGEHGAVGSRHAEAVDPEDPTDPTDPTSNTDDTSVCGFDSAADAKLMASVIALGGMEVGDYGD